MVVKKKAKVKRVVATPKKKVVAKKVVKKKVAPKKTIIRKKSIAGKPLRVVKKVRTATGKKKAAKKK